jgi:ABC-2 type transport system ATP-binding protein
VTQEEAIIDLNYLTKKFHHVTAVDNISMSIKKGTIHGFLGPNGAGKTTTIRMIMGLLKPNNGKITLFGKDLVKNEEQLKKKIGYLPGDVVLYNYYTVEELLDFFESIRGLKTAPLRQNLVQRLELDETKTIKSLSKGNIQKVGLVQALMHDPDLLILDEPTASLDPLLKLEFFKIIKEFKERDKTILFSSHILSEVEKVCDYVSIIKNGRIMATENIISLNKKVGRKIILEVDNDFDPKIMEREGCRLISHTNGKYVYVIESSNVKKLLKETLENRSIKNYLIPELKIEDYFLQFYDN